MKNRTLILLMLLNFTVLPKLFSQNVSVNSTGNLPDTSAMLDVSSTAKGFLLPRMTTTQQNAIILPAKGLIIYNTTINAFEVNIGTAASPVWSPLGNGSGSVTSVATGYGLSGGPITTAGTLIVDTLNLSNWYIRRKDSTDNTGFTTLYQNGLKQNQLNGTGLVKATGTTISYDNNTYITANQSITFTPAAGGDVTGTASGTVSLTPTLTIGANKVTLGQMAQVANGTFLGRTSAGSGNVEAMTTAQAKVLLGSGGTNSGDVTLAGQNYLTIAGQVITANPVNLSGANVTGTLAAARFPALTGDVTNTAGALATTIAAGVVSNSKLATMAANTFKANATASVASPTDINGTQATAMLNTFNTLKGLVPGTASSTVNFLRADGTWQPVSTTAWGLTGNAGTNSGTNFLGSTDNASVVFKSNGVQRMILDSLGSVGVGTSPTFTPGLYREKFLVDAGTTTSYNPMVVQGSIDSFFQFNIQNLSVGTHASSDIVATSNNGTQTSNYVDMGINGSANTSNIFGKNNDAYLYNQGENFFIATSTPAKSLIFMTGGTDSATNERMRINGIGNIGIGNPAPTEKLDVAGNVRFSGALMPNNLPGTAGSFLTSNGAGSSPTWTSGISGTNTGDVTLGTANGLSLAGQVLSLGLSGTSANGALDSTDWNTFNNKLTTIDTTNIPNFYLKVRGLLSAGVGISYDNVAGIISNTGVTSLNGSTGAITIPTGDLTEAGSSVLTITGGATAVLGTGTTLQVKQASGTQNGFLSSTDWTTFNSRLSTIDTTNISNFYLKVRSELSGGTGITYNNSTGTITNSGVLSLNGNVGALTMDTGYISSFSTKVQSLLSATAPITYSNGVIGITQATTSSDGYLSSTDWNTFNNKSDTANRWSTTGNSGTVSATNFIGTRDNKSFNIRTNNTQGFLLDSLGNVAIGTAPAFSATNPEKLLVDAGTSSYNVISGKGNLNNYLQLNIKNTNPGTGASSDVVATNDAGTELNGLNYVDMGVNSTGNTSTGVLGGANTGYLYNTGNDFSIGTAIAGKNLILFTGGVASGNERLRIDGNGNVGIGVTTPTAVLHLKAGTAAVNTAPLKFTSGALLTTAAAGAVEFLTDKFYGTITTGASRKEFTLNETSLSSTRVPFANASGRLTDLAAFTYATNRLSPTYITLGAGTAVVNTAPLIFTSGVNLTTPVTGAVEFDGIHFYGTVGSTRYQLDQQAGTTYTASNGISLVGNDFRNNLITGIAGGQTIIGGTASANTLTLTSTSHVIKGKIIFGSSAYDELNNRLGVGNNVPTEAVDITGNLKFSGALMPNNLAGSAGNFLSSNGAGTAPTWITFDTTSIASFSQKVRSLFSATAPITYSNGLIGITQATGTTNGYLSSADWTTFNNKQPQLNGTGFVKATGTVISYDNSTYLTANQTISFAPTGDVTGSTTGTTTIAPALVIGTNRVLNTMLAQMPTLTIKGNNTGGTANASDLTVAQVNAILPVFTTALNGLVPFNGASAGKVLHGDGTWKDTTASTNQWSTTGNAGTTSAINFIGTTDNNNFKIKTNNTQGFLLDTLGNVSLGLAPVFSTTNPEKLLVDAGSGSFNVISGKGNLNNFLQLNIKNSNAGTAASSDVVATNDAGTEANGINYVDMGINSSGYLAGGVLGGASNAYLYATGNDFIIGNNTSGKPLRFFTTATSTSAEAMRIDSAGNLGIGTTTPTAALHLVKGSTGGLVIFQNTNVAGYSSADFLSNTGTLAGTFGYGNSGSGGSFAGKDYFNSYGNDFNFVNGSTSDIYIKASNNFVGIGTTTPGNRLQVAGTDPLSLLGVQLGTNTSTDSVLTITGGVVKKLPASTFATSAGSWSTTGNNSTSAATNFIGTIDNQSFKIKTNNAQGFLLDSLGNAAIGTAPTFSASNPEKLLVDAGTGSFNVISGKGNLNNFLQLNIKNTNAGTAASSDVVATNDAGNEVNLINYVDMGVNSSGNTSTGVLGGFNTGYLYSTGADFAIGNATAAKSLVFFTGGTGSNERMRIDGNGNVGIGTTAPATALHVVGTNPLTLIGVATGTSATTDSLLTITSGLVRKLPVSTFITAGNAWSTIGNTGTASGTNYLGTVDNQSLKFKTHAIQGMILDSLGSIGIGTSPVFTTGTPHEKLLVDAGVSGTTNFQNVITGKGNTNSYAQLNIQNGNAGTGASSDVVATADNGNETTNFIDMGINSSANSANFFGGLNDAYLYSIGNGVNSGGDLYIGTATASRDVVFLTGGGVQSSGLTMNNERMRVLGSNGNIGMGTATPTQTLDVNGSINAQSSVFTDGGAANTGAKTPGLVLGGASSGETISSKRTSGTNQYGIDFYTASINRMTVNNTGNVGIGTTTPVSKLDINGSVSNSINFATSAGTYTLDATNYTFIIKAGSGNAVNMILPAASSCTGRIYIVVDQGGFSQSISTYIDLSGNSQTSVASHLSYTLQSDGTSWYQIR